MALFSRKHIKPVELPYGLTEDDLIGAIKDIPMYVVVRMLEEQFSQKGKMDIKILQKNKIDGFTWGYTEAGWKFWDSVINNEDYDLFFKKYPDYERYNLS